MVDSDKQPLPLPPQRPRSGIEIGQVLTAIAVLPGIVASIAKLFGYLNSIGIPFLPSNPLVGGAVVLVAVSALAGVSALIVVLVRFSLAALSKIHLGKDDIYFTAAILASIASVLISHFWK